MGFMHLTDILTAPSLTFHALRQQWSKPFQVLAVVLSVVWGSAISHAQSLPTSVVTTPQVRAELVVHAPQGVQAGQSIMLGLLLQHQPGWHTYWLNPGDSGLATQLNWTLPDGLKAGPTLWPVPSMIPVANMVNHGYENQVLLASQVQIDKGFKPGPTHEMRLNAEWLVCKEECIPQSGQFVLKLNPQASTAGHAAAFAGLLEQQPTSLQPASQTARFKGQALSLDIQGLPSAVHGRALKAYAQSPEVLASGLGLAGTSGTWQNGRWQLDAPLHTFRSSTPNSLGLLLVDESTPTPQAWTVQLKIQGDWPALPQPLAPVSADTKPSALSLAAKPSTSLPPASTWALLSAMLGALLGGLLLNLMPCVLPVLAIKLLSLSQPSVTAGMRRGIGLSYTLGVLLSMLGLALLVMAVRASGEQLGWGFQLQSPWVVVALSLLFTLIALNLFGVLQVRAAWASGLAAQLARHPLADALLSGVLAVVVAAPCTAPFMGASVGLAFTLPAWQGLVIFLSLGLGLALPFLLACWWPVAADWLPRPGAWMETLRQALGFPMLATVVWLLWVLGQQTSIDASAVLLAALIALSGLVWALGLTGGGRHVAAAVFAAVLVWLVWVWGPVVTRVPALETSASSNATWQPWSSANVAQAHANGQAVFIDFTAAWCVTCQVNKQTTLRDPQVLQAFADKKVVLLRADWTRQDPAISAALNQLGRSGVPVYVLQAPGKEPQLLSELLTPTLVLAALTAL
jgi:thiol:disulfide interchange protein DsbD